MVETKVTKTSSLTFDLHSDGVWGPGVLYLGKHLTANGCEWDGI